MSGQHGVHCDGCRQLQLIHERSEAIAAAKAAFALLPEKRQDELNSKFKIAAMQAEAHASYNRLWCKVESEKCRQLYT